MRQLFIVLSCIALSSCGQNTSTSSSKLIDSSIINGTDVKAGSPIATSVVGVYNIKTKYLCTGTLISSNTVLTAAHCLAEHATQVRIVFSTDIDEIVNSREPDVKDEYSLPVTDAKASDKWNPEDEVTEHNTGDIAVMKFKGAVPRGFAPANFLPAASTLKIGDMITVAGYGVDFVDSSKKIDPKKVRDLEEAIEYGEIICNDDAKGNHLECFKVEYSGDGPLRTTEAPIKFILETEFHLNEKKSGTCSGDSGGPAFVKKDGSLFLVGVTSRGSGLCDDVGVYTNALYYKKWIDETSAKLK